MKVRLLHIVLLISVSTLVAGVGGVLVTYWVIEDEVQDLLDDDLAAQSELLAQVLAAERNLLSVSGLEALVVEIFEPDQEETLWINVYDPGTDRLVSNLDHALPRPEPGSGPVHLTLQDFQWFGYQHAEPGGLIVQLLHRRDRYREVREEVLEGVIVPAAAVGLINLGLLAGLTVLFLGPLTRMARDLEGRRVDSLVPLQVKTPALEVGVLRDALNRLMADVDRVLSREREFASDVAHELRTPLTTLKIELSSDDPDLGSVRVEVDRLARLVTQLLTLARLQRTEWRRSFEPVVLDSLCATTLREMNATLEAAGIALDDTLDSATVLGDRTLLDTLLRNLLGNVLHHCPRGGRATVTLRAQRDGVVLQIADTGPGLTAQQRQQLTVGPSRLDQRGQGLGLGLAICHKVAAVHDAALTFHAREDGSPGLVVRVRFPRLMPS